MACVKQTGRASSVPSGLITGVGTALAVTLIGSAIIAKLIQDEFLKEHFTGYGVMIILITAAWIGSVTASQRIKRRRIMVCFMTDILFYATLLGITGLFFGGEYAGVGETGLLIFCGSILSIFMKPKEKTAKKRKKFKNRNR